MLMGELATLVKYALPVKIIVLKNNVLGMIKWEQLAFEEPAIRRRPATDRLCRLCEGLWRNRLHGRRPRQVQDVLRQAFSTPGPVVVEAVIDPLEAPLPGKSPPTRPGSLPRR